MKALSGILLLLFFVFRAEAQTPAANPEYKRLTDAAFRSLQADSCGPCQTYYEQAFRLSRHSALSHLRAALCAQLCGDSARAEKLSLQAVVLSWATCEKVLDEPTSYPEFKRIARTGFERELRAKIRIQAEGLGIDLALRDELRQIHENDQRYRVASNPHPPGSPEHKAFTAELLRSDSLNLASIETILQWYGYPGKSKVGDIEGATAWLVIQHAPLEKQLQYYPLIDAAAQAGELPQSNRALLLDRIRVGQGLPQIYGSQVVRDPDTGQWKLHPIEDAANVDRRRAEVGLGPLADYALRFGIVWKV